MCVALSVAVVLAACAKGGEYRTSTRDRPKLFDRVAHDFSRALGAELHDGQVYAQSMALLPDGVLLGGAFEAPGMAPVRLGDDASLEPRGSIDGFIARARGDGTVSWARALGSAAAERVTAVAADPSGRMAVALSLFEAAPVELDGARMAVRGQPGALIITLDADGRVMASLPLHTDGHVHIRGLASAEVGGRPSLIAAGMFHGTVRVADRVLTSEGGGDILTLALDFRGRLAWAKRDGGKGADAALGLAARGQRVIVAGAFTDRARIGDRDLVAAPRPGRFRRPGQDGFVAALSAKSGAIEWLKTISGPGQDSVVTVAVGADDRTYAAGVFEAGARVKLRTLTAPGASDDIFMLALDEAGGIAWSKALGGPGVDRPVVVAAHQGGVALTGTFEQELPVDAYRLASAGGHDIFALAADRDGEIQWARRFGGPGQDAVSAMLAADQGLILCGAFSGQADLGGEIPLDAAGQESGFVMRIH